MKFSIKLDRVSWNLDRIDAAKRRCMDRGLFKAAGFLRTDARRSIKQRKTAAPAGSPPATRKGRLRKAIVFHVFRGLGRAIVGPTANIVGPAGGAHEHGGQFRGESYPARPFMGPALVKTNTQFAAFFRDEFK